MASLLKALGLAAAHRPFDDADRHHLRRAPDGAPVDASSNPGLRVLPGFVRPDEAAEVEACARDALDRFGATHVSRAHRKFFEDQMAHLGPDAPEVNMLRVTGRFEAAGQPLAPWGYGDAFDAARLPEPLARLARRAQTADGLAHGALRDVTINYRKDGFFRLDGHVDPLADGPNVCIVGLLSDTVLTISEVGPPESTTADPARVALESWAAGDVDVLLPARCLVHLSGRARDELNHGIRLGVSATQLRERGVPADDGALFDWHGSIDRPVRRSPERISIVFAFAGA